MRLGLSERTFIEAGIYRKMNFADIAKQLGVQPRAVSEEIRRNRIYSPATRYFGKDCRFASECGRRFVCGNTLCVSLCVTCRKFDCTKFCKGFSSLSCNFLNKPPYVCNVCQLRRGCVSDRAYYIAVQANAIASKRYSDARSNPHVVGDTLTELDQLVTPLIKKGQPLSHIYAEHGSRLPISERTLYRYIDSGFLGVGNLDLRRKVGYRTRKKKKLSSDAPNNAEYRKSRTYADFLKYIEKHPNTNYVEMDTVIGTRGKGTRMLTLHFVHQNLMIILYLRDGKAATVVEHFDWLTSALGLETFRKLFPVILTDNGSEFKRTLELERTVDGVQRTSIFYCDAQASWQKPHIEKNHEYIRYVIPKGKSFNTYTQKDFSLLASHINSTKRTQYGGKSPIELATSEEFKSLLHVVGIREIPADDVMLTPRLFRTEK